MTERSTLGIEGGGTRTTVLLAGADDDEVISRFECGPANLRLMQIGELQAHLRGIRQRLPNAPSRIGIGLAGVRLPGDHERLRTAVARVWPGVPCATSDDLLTALEAVEWKEDCEVQVLLLSGTGSCAAGRRRKDDSLVKLGGRGHILGDRASACDIAQHSLRAVMTISDRDNAWPSLGADILSFLQMNEPEDLIDWSLVASKTDLAQVAIPVFRAAEVRQDPIAVSVLDRAAARLSKDASVCAERLRKGDDRVQFVLNGAVLLKNPSFAENVIQRLREQCPNSEVTPLERPQRMGSRGPRKNS